MLASAYGVSPVGAGLESLAEHRSFGRSFGSGLVCTRWERQSLFWVPAGCVNQVVSDSAFLSVTRVYETENGESQPFAGLDLRIPQIRYFRSSVTLMRKRLCWLADSGVQSRGGVVGT